MTEDGGHPSVPTEAMKLIQPPADPLLAAIPNLVRDGWRRNATQELIRRLEILCACGPRPADHLQTKRLMYNRAWRAAGETYVYCAFACGFFEGERGKDLYGRFSSIDPDDFRSAWTGCLACWFLAGRMHFSVNGDATGRPEKKLDMKVVIGGQEVGVEVKAPYRECPSTQRGFIYGHDGDLLAKALTRANKQFSDDVSNLLVIVPQLRAFRHAWSSIPGRISREAVGEYTHPTCSNQLDRASTPGTR